ncbi:alpha/beta fold hydrolase [Nocardiopsis kunsanensis]|uniref:alpha/beta fold hydrolase n=1 Tax=Nocardiopsis kunsanensis TaxID=141693 RepID=UPI0003465CF9|nr:alpha/beta fold hydrolase [Nocardiopsis kunsanensis]
MATRHLGPADDLQVRSDDGTLLHVEVRGPEDGPTVVLSHCWATSLASWGPVVRELDPNLRVVLYDQRGHGRSQQPLTEAGYGPHKLADDLCAVLEATVSEGRKAVVAGHSMGGMTIMASGGRNTFHDKIGAVLLTNTGSVELPQRSTVFPLPSPFAALATKGFLQAPLPLGPRNAATTAALKYITMGRDADPRTVNLCVRMVHECNGIARGRWGAVLNHLDIDRDAARITAPTVIVAGSEDKMTPPWHAHHTASVIPGADRPVEIGGVGHMGPLEMPGFLAEQVGKLVNEHVTA